MSSGLPESGRVMETCDIPRSPKPPTLTLSRYRCHRADAARMALALPDRRLCHGGSQCSSCLVRREIQAQTNKKSPVGAESDLADEVCDLCLEQHHCPLTPGTLAGRTRAPPTRAMTQVSRGAGDTDIRTQRQAGRRRPCLTEGRDEEKRHE